MSVEAVLFDLDGTLIDSEGLWWEAECAVVAELGGVWLAADQEHCLGGPLERVADYMVQLTRCGVGPDVVGQRLLDSMESRLRSEPLRWRPGARELLIACRSAGIPVGLVSASHRRLLAAVADAVALEVLDTAGDPFDVTVAGDEVSDSKPHPEPYLLAARMLGVDIERCVVIEDSPTGVAAGQSSGVYVIAVPHMVPIPPAHRRTVRDSLSGLTVDDLHSLLATI